MIARRSFIGLVLAAGLVSAFVFAGCSKDKTTNPTPGGGGGGVNVNTFNSGTLSGGTFAHTFNSNPDTTINYVCLIHAPAMAGVVHVLAGSPASVDVNTVSNTGFSPNPALVAPGGTITWHISGTHTVTSQ